MKNRLLNRYLIGFSIVAALFTITHAEAVKWKTTSDGKLVRIDSSESDAKPSPNAEDPSVIRTRKQISMLDDLYKTAVVLITEHYVNDPGTLSAATASKALFAAMKKKGWHEARLLGFTDLILNPDENLPKDEFEQTAKTELLKGEPTYEQVVTKNGKRYLRMATSVPVVMEKCIMCHANFEGKEGAIGAISYTAPLIK